MLKQRIITAAILIPIFVLLVLLLTPRYFALLTTVIIVLASWEWTRLMEIKGIWRICYPASIFVLLPFSLLVSTYFLLIVAFIWWCLALILVWCYPTFSRLWGRGLGWRSIMGLLVLIPAWRAVNYIRDFDIHDGPVVLLFLLVLIWGADSVAYFAGKKWGKHKLAPQVSPGKTREGLYGALFSAVILAFIPIILLQANLRNALCVIGICLATVLYSVLGDLFESMLKRNVGLKDSGQLIPGHGGLLDRIDSLLAAAPVFALGYLWTLKFK